MVTRSPMTAKAMKPVDINALNHTGSTTPQFKPTIGMTTKSPKMPAKGENPRNAMIDGPYGGKKPQS